MTDSEKMEVSLKEYLEARLSYQEQALALAKQELERRLEAMNEFREQLHSQAQTFQTKERAEIENDILSEKLEDLMLWRSRIEGKASIASLVSIGALVVSIAAVILHITQ